MRVIPGKYESIDVPFIHGIRRKRDPELSRPVCPRLTTRCPQCFVDEHSNTDVIPYLFNGKEQDEETGLYYYGARYYDPRTSIWQSVDPMAEKNGSWSPYAFAGDNPEVMIDPDGKDWFYYQAKNEKGKSWHFQEGHKATYTNTPTRTITSGLTRSTDIISMENWMRITGRMAVFATSPKRY